MLEQNLTNYFYEIFIGKTLLNNWVTNNFNELRNICTKITRGNHDDVDDLLQLTIEQFLNNRKVLSVPDEQKLFFYTRIVKNQYNSKNSSYYYIYKKHSFSQPLDVTRPSPELDTLVDEPYEESIFDLEWVKKQLKSMDWYYGRLFELYIEEGCSVTKLSHRTTIPINSVSRDINKVRRELNKRRNKTN